MEKSEKAEKQMIRWQKESWRWEKPVRVKGERASERMGAKSGQRNKVRGKLVDLNK